VCAQRCHDEHNCASISSLALVDRVCVHQARQRGACGFLNNRERVRAQSCKYDLDRASRARLVSALTQCRLLLAQLCQRKTATRLHVLGRCVHTHGSHYCTDCAGSGTLVRARSTGGSTLTCEVASRTSQRPAAEPLHLGGRQVLAHAFYDG
jgi:hypothetical protein